MSWGRTAQRSKEASSAAVVFLELCEYHGHAVLFWVHSQWCS
jgi:hypothetical protein